MSEIDPLLVPLWGREVEGHWRFSHRIAQKMRQAMKEQRLKEIAARAEKAVDLTKKLRDEDVSLSVLVCRHDIPHLLAALAQARAALEECAGWFDETDPERAAYIRAAQEMEKP